MKKIVNHIVGGVLVFGLMGVPLCLASELTVPNQFSSGDVTSASDVNANFAAIEAAVNDNHARIQEGLQSQSRPVFVGFSTEQVLGQSGLNSWQQACHNLSPGSHTCTDYELIVGPYNPDAPIPEGTAWVGREIQSANVSTGSSHTRTDQFSKIMSCHNGYGYTVVDGRFSSSTSCSQVLPVACCK